MNLAQRLELSTDTLSEANKLFLGKLEFPPDLKVSPISKFNDQVWDLRNGSADRLVHYSDGDLQIKWGEKTIDSTTEMKGLHHFRAFIPLVPPKIISEIKRAVFLYMHFPYFLSRRINSKGRHPYTIVRLADMACNFFSWICMEMERRGKPQPSTLNEINLNDIAAAIESYPYNLYEPQKYLWIFANEIVKKNFEFAPPIWTERDLLQLKWPQKKRHESYETLPNELFKLCSKSSTEIVGCFLEMANLPIKDTSYQKNHFSYKGFNLAEENLLEMLDQYSKCRHRQSVNRGDTLAYRDFAKRFQWSPGKFGEYLSLVQVAAQVVILLYTGMRSSDCRTVKAGCLNEKNGHWFIRATHIKNRNLNAKTGQDEWLAIDCVCDAITALERLSVVIQNRALFSPFFNKPRDPFALNLKAPDEFIDDPMSAGTINYRVSKFLKYIDSAQQWTGWKPHTHQFRHGLTYQLARAEVGIPYITRQLKHKSSILSLRSYKINPVTPVYGTIRNRLLITTAGAGAYRAANLEIVADIFGEGRRYAGGGAVEHKRRVDEFFRGLGLQGKDRIAYLEKLAKNGITLVRTGIGYCMRNHSNPMTLKEAPPPCIGDLKCNPHTCRHSVVPEAQIPVLIKHLDSTEKHLANSEMLHLRPIYEQQKAALEAMLSEFNVTSNSKN